MSDRPLRRRAARIRADMVRLAHASGAAGIGSALSVVDVLAVLYGACLRLDDAGDVAADRLILGKPAAALALYATLAEYGHLDRPSLLRYARDDAALTVHPHHAVPGVALTVVLDGTALGVGLGLARADRRRRVFALLGDAECDRGEAMPAAALAARDGIDNLVAFVDRNGFHGPRQTQDEPGTRADAACWRSLGWEVREVDGHAYPELARAFERLPARAGRPTVVIGATTKGAGISFMENDPSWHERAPDDDELRHALAELGDTVELG